MNGLGVWFRGLGVQGVRGPGCYWYVGLNRDM